MISYPSIKNFATLYKTVANKTRTTKLEDGSFIINNDIPLPTISFIGTTKSHGTNSSIVLLENSDELIAQSRNRVLNLQHDNLGFCAYECLSGFYEISV